MDYSPCWCRMRASEFGTVEIKRALSERSNSELLQIWRENNRHEWRPEAFEVVREILLERGIEPPDQQILSTAQAENAYESKRSKVREVNFPRNSRHAGLGLGTSKSDHHVKNR